MLAQRIAVARYPQELPRVSHPSAGHIIRARPKNAAFIQKVFDLSSGLLRSDKIACATDTFPQVIPSNIREINIIKIGRESIPSISMLGKSAENPNIIQLRNVPAWVISKMGFLPYISDTAQKIGAAIN